MEKDNPLLPFAYTNSSINDPIPYDTTPRDKSTIDENASSKYHTRKTITSISSSPLKPQLRRVRLSNQKLLPSLKRKMGESFNDKDNIKRVDIEDFYDESNEEREETSTVINVDNDNDHEENENENENDKNQLPPSSPPPPILYSDVPLVSEFDFTTNLEYNFGVPKSPTKKIDLNLLPTSEFDEINPIINNDDDNNDDDDEKTNNVENENNFIKKKKILKELSSDADFGIDRFNRFNGTFKSQQQQQQQLPPALVFTSSTCTDSTNNTSTGNDNDMEDINEKLKQSSYNRARNIILNCFENMQTIINLENMNLYDLPSEIKDLNNLVIFNNLDNGHENGHGNENENVNNPFKETTISTTQLQSQSISYQLYLTNNNLTELPISLFKFTKLQVLGLRINQLKFLPPLIDKLINLVDLSLGSNSLKFLPYQILNLKKLINFRAGPNPFISIDDFNKNDIITIPVPTSMTDSLENMSLTILKYRTKIIYLNNHHHHHHHHHQQQQQQQEQEQQSCCNIYLPSLTNLCLNKLGNYDVNYKETKIWKKKIPKFYHKLIKLAIIKGKFNFNDTCNQCNLIIVNPLGEIFEWYDILLNKNIPIRKQFCSQRCIDKYLLQFSSS